MREGAFPAPEDALDEGGRRSAARHRVPGGGIDLALVSPALAARQTAEALGMEASVVHSLRDIGHGNWTGQSFEAVQLRDAAALAAWLADPAKGTPGGESLSDLLFRVAPWLEAQAGRDQHVVAVTHPMVVRAVLVAALGIAPSATMRIDIAPLTAVRLSFNGGWRLQAIAAA